MTQTDIANVPLGDISVDIGVFCLSLMGTNFPDFILESNRVIKHKGMLIVAEVLSRFKDVNQFLKHMNKQAGFKVIKVKKLHDFFYLMIFQKNKEAKFNEWNQEFA